MKREKGQSSFENLPRCAAEYIRLVIKKMRWQKKVRGDVQAELICHFEDALKDCKTNEEREKTAKEIISEFGDAKMLAILARRAKKRCRPLWHKTLIGVLQTIGIIIVLFILYIGWFLSGKPKITVDYMAELNRIVRPADANESQNAAFYYNEAVEKIGKLSDDVNEVFKKSYYECNEVERKSASDWLIKNRETLNLISIGNEKPYSWNKYEAKNNVVLAVLLPHLKEYRSISQILCWNAQLLAEQENYSQAFENITTAYNMGKHIRSEPFLIGQLVAMALESRSTQNLRQILSRYNVGSSELEKLQNDLQAITCDEVFNISYKTEKLFVYDALQRCFTDDIFGGHIYFKSGVDIIGEIIDGSNTPQEQGKHEVKRLFSILFTQPGKKETLKATDETYDYYEKLSALTPFEQRSIEPNMHEKLQEIAGKNILLTLCAPAFDKISSLSYRIKAEVQATTTIIAIIRYKQENGTYPDNLKELLNTGLIKEIPADPFSDKSLIYKKTEKGFTLYSVGPDFVDNGGIMGVDKDGKPRMWNEAGGDAVFWPVAEPSQKAASGGK